MQFPACHVLAIGAHCFALLSVSLFGSVVFGALQQNNHATCCFVQIFNLSSREILRTYNDHLRPVHLTRFTSFTQVMTGSDDTTVRCIDVPSQSMTAKMVGHTVCLMVFDGGLESGMHVFGNNDGEEY
jgi:WD40 repeat protein